ncbi:hypothetical protein CL614_03250 [archaeon]|nr:hypothetical protein [archaeon]|tara:strand:- start:901 stop:1143 length:243 start_codon:yes stop_codon:yes gene_type:complete
MKKMKNTSPKVLMAYALGKFLGGLGIGILLVSYLPDAMATDSWITTGWVVFAIAVIIGIAVLRELHRKRSIVEKIAERFD